MPYYKDPENKLHFLDDAAHENLLPAGCIQVSGNEAEAMQAPVPLTANQITLGQIVALEATVTPRRLREAVLGTDNGWLNEVNDQIAALRKSL